ncbi:hypothetical protein RYA05_01445 [Pseudomonas syringae pv. actinidiae]|nr:hypothetical protein [Pseudomonas syringae pv. actinidiae]
MKTLRDVMPHEINGYTDSRCHKWLDVEVIRVYDPYDGERTWPGKHKHVVRWCSLKNGRAVGWNENVAVGWSFPDIAFKEPEENK